MPANNYDFAAVEPKWQRYWLERKTFRAMNPGQPGFDANKPKHYVLDMFPYPSGAGLHVGHPEGYTATDILCRYKRMRGFNVLHPMGWDAFGLPAEQYAIDTGTHPAVTTKKNIATFRKQIQMLGFSYDWDREVDTTDPDYFRWTQWIFLLLFQRGLAYEAEVPVWWCEGCKAVLANEEVNSDGTCDRKGHKGVYRRPLRQWMLKITAYADRLLSDLDSLDWPEAIKEQQRNWIGRSEGAEVDFALADGPAAGTKLRVFTTRPDTLFGATYMVLAPEHPFVEKVTTPAQKAAVDAYRAQAARKSEIERGMLEKEKTGVFTGGHAVNPVSGEKIPIWIADYVMMGYGTGAIMAVPAHDTRDLEFAQKFNLPVRIVVQAPAGQESIGFVGDGTSVNSGLITGLPTPEAKKKITAWLEERGLGKATVNFRLRDWLFSRQRYWGEPIPIVHCEDCGAVPVPQDQLPLRLPEMTDYTPTGSAEPPLAKATDWVNTACPKCGRPAKRETNTMPQWAGSCWYYLRYLDPKNAKAPWSKEAEQYWMPVDLYVGGAEHAVLHLLYARFWHKVLFDAGYVHTREPFQRLFNQGMILGITYRAPNDSVVPYKEVHFDGDTPRHPETREVLRMSTEKMSKSLGNVINPDDVVKEYGADTLRLYEMFMGPLEVVKPWNMRDVAGVHRFLNRAYRVFVDENGNLRPTLRADAGSPDLERALHQCIRKVTEDLDHMAFNTAISAMMIFVNEATKDPSRLGRSQAERFLLLLAPFAPHLSEELWQMLGHSETLAYEPWPAFDPDMLKEDSIELPVQVSGKLRSRIRIPITAAQADIEKAAMADDKVRQALEGKTVRKVIVVPKRMVNIVAG